MNRWTIAGTVLTVAVVLAACQPTADETDEAPAAVAPVGPLDDAISAQDLPPDDAIPAEEEVPDDVAGPTPENPDDPQDSATSTLPQG